MLNPDQFKGRPYEAEIEWVPTDAISRLREYDRETEPKPGTDLNALTDDIERNGIRSPAIIMYGHGNQHAYVGEGNHRIAAALRLGIPAVPARVVRMTSSVRGSEVPGYQRSGHVPGDLRPSDIGLPTVDPTEFSR